MIKRLLLGSAALLFMCVTSRLANADGATVGQPAPEFTLKDAKGDTVSLKSFLGKTVVLEWFNPGCPFVKKFYAHGDMPKFQQQVLDKGGVWLTISSSAKDKPGHIDPSEAAGVFQELQMRGTELLLDSDGVVGTRYGARTTPHMFVIDPKGIVAYSGAIDSNPSTRASDIEAATNYVISAVEALANNKTPSPATTEPYGCSIKYATPQG